MHKLNRLAASTGVTAALALTAIIGATTSASATSTDDGQDVSSEHGALVQGPLVQGPLVGDDLVNLFFGNYKNER